MDEWLPPLSRGSEIGDWGHLTLSRTERDTLLDTHSEATKWIRPFVGGRELVRGVSRWVLYFADDPDGAWMECASIRDRLGRVRAARQASKRKNLMDRPWEYFHNQPTPMDPLVFPQVTSGARRWIPCTRVPGRPVVNGKAFFTTWSPALFALLSSSLHMEWTRLTAGRLKADLSYSNLTTYNTIPPPTHIGPADRCALARAESNLVAARESLGGSLAEIYRPGHERAALLDAHNEIDTIIDGIYRCQSNGTARLERLLTLYEGINAR